MPAPIPTPPCSIRSSRMASSRRWRMPARVGGRSGWTPRHLVLKDAQGSDRRLRALLSESPTARANTCSTTPGPTPTSGRAATTIPSCRSPCRSRPCPGGACWCGPGPTPSEQRGAAGRRSRRRSPSATTCRACTSRSSARASGSGSASRGFLKRTDQQFHWSNAGYATFDDFLASLASRKRKAVRKERARGAGAGPRHRVGARPRHHGGALGRVLRLLHGHGLAQVGPALSQPQGVLAARRGDRRALPADVRQARQARRSPARST